MESLLWLYRLLTWSQTDEGEPILVEACAAPSLRGKASAIFARVAASARWAGSWLWFMTTIGPVASARLLRVRFAPIRTADEAIGAVNEYMKAIFARSDRATTWFGRFRNFITPAPRIRLPLAIVFIVAAMVITMSIIRSPEVVHQVGQAAVDSSPPAGWGMFSTKLQRLSKASESVADPMQVVMKIGNNVRMIMYGPNNELYANAVFLSPVAGGNVVVTTAHGLVNPGEPICMVVCGKKFLPGERGGLVHDSIKVVIPPDSYYHIPERDLVFMFVQAPNQFPDISKYLPDRAHNATSRTQMYCPSFDRSGELVYRTSPGSVYTTEAISVNKGDAPRIERVKCTLLPETAMGDCGSPYVQTIGNRTALVALHHLGGSASGNTYGTPISRQDFDIAKAHVLASNTPVATDILDFQNARATPGDLLDRVDQYFHKVIPPTATLELNPLHDRSPLRQQNLPDGVEGLVGTLDIRGSIPSSSVPQATKIKIHPLKEDLLRVTGLPEGKKKPPPPMDRGMFYKARRYFLGNILAIRRTLSSNLIRQAVMGFLSDALTRSYHGSMAGVRPLTRHESVNGVPADAPLSSYMSKLVMSTSAGYPHSGPKFNLLKCREPGNLRFNDSIESVCQEIEAMVRAGQTPGSNLVLFDAFFKDEPMSLEKITACKHRVVIGSPVAFLIVFRQFFLPIIAFVGSNRIAFEACPSTVVQSREWTTQRKFVVGEGRKYFDGDYKGWDSSLQKILVVAFFQVAMSIAILSGNYDDSDLMAMATLANVVTDPNVNFFGDVICLSAFNPSGQPATALTNSFANSILFRYTWIASGHSVTDFRHNVRLLTYGDDNWGSIEASAADTYSKIVHDHHLTPHGICYTNADKTPDLKAFSDLDSVDFLKRSWVWSDELSADLAPLALTTLGGMCSTLRTSTHASEDSQIVDGMISLAGESFFHGEDFFRSITAAITEVLLDNGFTSDMFKLPEYESKVRAYVLDSEYFLLNEDGILECLSK